MPRLLVRVVAVLTLSVFSLRAAPAAWGPGPTKANVAYGPSPANVLDFWATKSADAAHPAPVIVYFHGWGSDKATIRQDGGVFDLLAAGASVVSANFRDRATGGTFPEGLRDCARVIQFLRTQAKAWNIDPRRVAAYGTSFGGTASLWLAFHDDMADPRATDPVLRQSTRLACAGSISGQFSLDPYRWIEAFGEDVVNRFGAAYRNPQLWGFATEEALNGPMGRKVRADCDVIALITKDDPPVFLVAHRPNALRNTGEFEHHPKLTEALYNRCRAVGVAAVADIPALGITPAAGEPANTVEFARRQLQLDKQK